MGYSSRCSICTHKDAETINDLLRRRALGEGHITYEYIMGLIEEKGGVPVTACALSRHQSKHFDVAAEGRRRAAEQYEAAASDVERKVVDDLMVLDKIRDLGFKMIEDGELVPDIKDVLSAISTKHGKVMKEANPVEALIDLVANAARGASE